MKGGRSETLAVLPDGRLVSAANHGSSFGTLHQELSIPSLDTRGESYLSLAVLSNECIASGSGSGTIRIWDLKSCTEAVNLKGHLGNVEALTVLTNGRLASSGSSDCSVMLWDAFTAVAKLRVVTPGKPISALIALPDGNLATGSADGIVRLWDATTGSETLQYDGHSGGVFALANLKDQKLVTGSGDGTIRVFQINRNITRAQTSHDGEVTALSVLPHDRLASGYDDCTIRIWDLNTGTELHCFREAGLFVRALAVANDGRLVSGSNNGWLHVWDLESGNGKQAPFVIKGECGASVSCPMDKL